jgi:hypothetical protein
MKETTPEPQPGLQGEGGFGRYQGREGAGRTGRTIRCTSKPEHDLEIAASRKGCRVFGAETKPDSSPPAIDVKTLHAKIGELTLERDFLSGALGRAGLLSSAKR